jgi:hypothetical protein
MALAYQWRNEMAENNVNIENGNGVSEKLKAKKPIMSIMSAAKWLSMAMSAQQCLALISIWRGGNNGVA